MSRWASESAIRPAILMSLSLTSMYSSIRLSASTSAKAMAPVRSKQHQCTQACTFLQLTFSIWTPLGRQTVSSLERCPLFRASSLYREVPLYTAILTHTPTITHLSPTYMHANTHPHPHTYMSRYGQVCDTVRHRTYIWSGV